VGVSVTLASYGVRSNVRVGGWRWSYSWRREDPGHLADVQRGRKYLRGA
jgi:hypothetical protein